MTFSILPFSNSLKHSVSPGALFGGVGPEPHHHQGTGLRDQAREDPIGTVRFYFHRGPLHACDAVDTQETRIELNGSGSKTSFPLPLTVHSSAFSSHTSATVVQSSLGRFPQVAPINHVLPSALWPRDVRQLGFAKLLAR